MGMSSLARLRVSQTGCQMIGLNVSTYYYQPKVPRKDREHADAALRDKIEWLQANWRYRTLKSQLLLRYGLQVNGKRSVRVMRKYDLFRRIKRQFIRTTDSAYGFPV
jgi:hypothetical protein